jgi:hypothetical protein
MDGENTMAHPPYGDDAPTSIAPMPDSTIADDMLRGAAAIAAYIGETVRRTNYLLERKCLPAFKQAGSWRMRKSAYRSHIERLESNAAATRAA